MSKARREDAARELSALLQTGYADLQRDDLVARERQQISTDSLINLPATGWPTVRARIPFVAQTLPMDEPDSDLAKLHRAPADADLAAGRLPLDRQGDRRRARRRNAEGGEFRSR